MKANAVVAEVAVDHLTEAEFHVVDPVLIQDQDTPGIEICSDRIQEVHCQQEDDMLAVEIILVLVGA